MIELRIKIAGDSISNNEVVKTLKDLLANIECPEGVVVTPHSNSNRQNYGFVGIDYSKDSSQQSKNGAISILVTAAFDAIDYLHQLTEVQEIDILKQYSEFNNDADLLINSYKVGQEDKDGYVRILKYDRYR